MQKKYRKKYIKINYLFWKKITRLFYSFLCSGESRFMLSSLLMQEKRNSLRKHLSNYFCGFPFISLSSCCYYRFQNYVSPSMIWRYICLLEDQRTNMISTNKSEEKIVSFYYVYLKQNSGMFEKRSKLKYAHSILLISLCKGSHFKIYIFICYD